MTTARSARRTTANLRPQGRLLLRQAARFQPRGGGGQDLEPKDALLLAYLAIEGPTSRAQLAALLWPDADEERARGNLRQRLLRMKRAVGIELVVGTGQAQLAEGIRHDLDDAHELLELVGLDEAGEFAGWLEAQRERRRRGRADALAAAAAKAEAEGDHAAALEHAGALLDFDPLSEDAHRRVMRLHYVRGDAGAALAAYRRCVRILRSELGAEPSRETRELKGQIEKAVPPPPAAKAMPAVPVAILRPPRLIGRAAELAAMAQAWDTHLAFLLLGEAGMGKSRTLAEFAHEHRGVTVVQARPGDAGVPYATLARVLRTAMAGKRPELPEDSRGQLARLLPELLPASVAPQDGQRVQLQQAIEAVLLDVQRDGVRGIVLDDLHFADDASVEMLRMIVSDERDGNLRWGFAQRTGEPTAAAQALRDTLEDAFGLRTVALAPLDAVQMAALVDSLGLADLDGSAIAERLVRHTGGNPMFALETLKHALAAGGTDAKLPRPASVGALIERRLRQLSPPAIALARVAAVAGVDFSIEMAEHVLKTPAVALADAWNELESAQVLKGAAFAHDLVFEATLRSMPEAIATHTHGSIAEWLERADGEPARIAAHWEATTMPQRALPWLHKAAERAFAAMRPREGIEFLVRAAVLEAAHRDAVAGIRLAGQSRRQPDHVRFRHRPPAIARPARRAGGRAQGSRPRAAAARRLLHGPQGATRRGACAAEARGGAGKRSGLGLASRRRRAECRGAACVAGRSRGRCPGDRGSPAGGKTLAGATRALHIACEGWLRLESRGAGTARRGPVRRMRFRGAGMRLSRRRDLGAGPRGARAPAPWPTGESARRHCAGRCAVRGTRRSRGRERLESLHGGCGAAPAGAVRRGAGARSRRDRRRARASRG